MYKTVINHGKSRFYHRVTFRSLRETPRISTRAGGGFTWMNHWLAWIKMDWYGFTWIENHSMRFYQILSPSIRGISLSQASMVHTILQLLITAVLCRYLPRMSLVQRPQPHPEPQRLSRDSSTFSPPCVGRVTLSVKKCRSLLRNGCWASL